MKITVEYEGQPIVVDIPDETLKQIANSQKKKTGWEKPQHGDYYWFIDHEGLVHAAVWGDYLLDQDRYDHGNSFSSNELAENLVRYRTLDARIRRRIAEICEPVDWKNHSQTEFTISYDYVDNMCCITSLSYIRKGQWFCDTREHAEQIIEEFKDELTWCFTEFKDRMDG